MPLVLNFGEEYYMISGVSAPHVSIPPPPAKLSAGRANAPAEVTAAKETNGQAPGQLSEDEKIIVEKLKKIDQEVRAHEQAHKNAGGQFAGSASFGYEVGPDGRRYAVSGEVPIDIAPVQDDPAATIAKMATIVAAALAPAKPSGQDRQVAAQAASIRADAQVELAQKSREELTGEGEEDSENLTSRIKSASAAYEGRSIPENGEKISGIILDLVS